MGETITSKGKTTKEALDLALKLLNKKLSEVDVEILEHGEKGFLGFKSKPAVVRITVKETRKELTDEPQVNEALLPAEMNEEQNVNVPVDQLHAEQDFFLDEIKSNLIKEELSGKAWVLKGKVYCKDAEDKYALIEPIEEVNVYKNGELINTTTVISETDVFKVEVINNEVPPSWAIQLSADKMEAFLIIKAGGNVRRVLKDKKPSSYIKLEVEEIHTPIPINIDEVLDKLKELEITHGLDYEAISEACTLGKDGTFLVAKGIPPIEGKHGTFQLVSEIEVKNQLKERLDGTVDFRETREFPSVDYGQIIGEIVPPIEGKAGVMVTGNAIEPEKVYPLQLKAGTGVIIVDNSKVVATEAGYPEVKMSEHIATVSVVPKLIIKHDVTIETGNIHYLGAVEVKASIQDSMTVEANGNILVEGNTVRAKVLSGKSIIVKNNVIASHLTAGNGSLVKVELSQLLITLANELNNMSAAIKQLSQIPEFKVEFLKVTGLGPLVKILYNSKFKDFQPLVADIVKKIKAASATLETEWVDFAYRLYRDFVTVQVSTLKSEDDLEEISKQAEVLYLSVSTEKGNESTFIEANFVQNSNLYSNGDIIISGQGVYSSNLFARKSIKIDGFVRGGNLYAEENVSIYEVGDRAGSNVKISVSKKGTIKIKHASENTVIEVGKQSEILFTKATNIFARLDDLGRLVINKEE